MAPANIGTRTSNPTLKKYVTSIGKKFWESKNGIANRQAIKFKRVGIPNKIINPDHFKGLRLFIFYSFIKSRNPDNRIIIEENQN